MFLRLVVVDANFDENMKKRDSDDDDNATHIEFISDI